MLIKLCFFYYMRTFKAKNIIPLIRIFKEGYREIVK